MGYKLKRIDTQDGSMIQLGIGTHMVGRGTSVQNSDEDLRVSRNHARLEVTTNTVRLKSLHQNPCFYIKKNSREMNVLKQCSTVCLYHGDKFGLAPDNLWFEVHAAVPTENAQVPTG